MAHILAVANQKGGIGKTTTATALAAGLQLKGHSVLLIDTDPQCNASDTYQAKIEGYATLYDLLLEGEPVSETIQSTRCGDIIASDRLLFGADQKMTSLGKEHTLKKAVAPVADRYEYIVIDTPPGAGVLLSNALTMAEQVIIPITADRYGLQGLSHLKDTIKAVQEYTNPGLSIAGLLLIKHNNRTNLSRLVANALPGIAEDMGTVLFGTHIRESVAAKEAQTNQTTLFLHAPDSTTATDYLAFIDELLERRL